MWRFDHGIFGRVSHKPQPQPIIPQSRGREDSAFAFFFCFLGRQKCLMKHGRFSAMAERKSLLTTVIY
ncbi:unnamed protein product [Prunus brigantina]